MLAAFQLYGPAHIITLLFLASCAVWLIFHLKKSTPSQKNDRGVTILAILCFASYPLNQASETLIGNAQQLNEMLPLHLCDLTAFICGFALLTRRPLLCELSYFWGLAGTMQGLITPDISCDFTSPLYYSFFLQHGSIVITAFVLPLGLAWRPRPRAAIRTYGWLLVYAISIFAINFFLHTNFGFVMEKPDGESLLNVLGPWPWYVFWTLLIAAALFVLLELPFKRSQRKSKQI